MISVTCDLCHKRIEEEEEFFSTVTMKVGDECIYSPTGAKKIHMCQTCHNIKTTGNPNGSEE